MNLFEAIVLGAVQGLTEFLPVSSSGHLILARHLFGMQQESQAAFVFDILIQMGTWLAVLVYYRHDLVAIGGDMLRAVRGQPGPQARLGWLVLLATVPAVIAGWLLKDMMSGLFSTLTATGVFMLGNALLLTIAEFFGRRKRSFEEASYTDALWVGTFQALALFPAVSRSAAALSGAMTRNFNRREAARFAFLMAVPIMPAAAVVGILDLGSLPAASGLLLPLLVGTLAAAVVGYLSIRWLLNYLSTHSLFPFAAYCVVIGLAAIFLS